MSRIDVQSALSELPAVAVARAVTRSRQTVYRWRSIGPPLAQREALVELIGSVQPVGPDALGELLARLGCSRAELARRIGCHRSQVGRWLAGGGVPVRWWPTIRHLAAHVDAREELQALMDRHGWTRAQLAKHLCVSPALVSHWMRAGQVPERHQERLAALHRRPGPPPPAPEWIAARRRAKRLPRRRLAVAAGVCPARIYEYERGVPVPARHRGRLLRALGRERRATDAELVTATRRALRADPTEPQSRHELEQRVAGGWAAAQQLIERHQARLVEVTRETWAGRPQVVQAVVLSDAPSGRTPEWRPAGEREGDRLLDFSARLAATGWSDGALASELGCSRRAVGYWKRCGVPPSRVRDVERLLMRGPSVRAGRSPGQVVLAGVEIQAARRRAGLTQAELARLIGRRWQSTVSAWERDGLRDPELAERILELLRHVATGNDCARQELAAARAALGWSRDRLARELGVSRRRVVAYEAGRRVVPDVTRAAVRSLASSAPPVLDAATLRARREALGLSQAVLARRAGLWQSQVHACEHGARLAPLLRARLWRALETTPPAADPRAARRERILALIAEHPGLSGKQILGRAATSWRDVLAALQELELGGQVHQRSEAYVDSTGRRRHRRGWQPGPAPTTRQHTPGAGDLRELRSVAGITLTELAAHLGVSAAALSRYERGIVPMPAPLCRDAHAIVAGAPRAVVVPTAVELRRVRRALGTSQGEFGRLLGVSRDTVGDWERRRPIPVSGWRAALERLSARVDAGDVRAIALSAALQQRH